MDEKDRAKAEEILRFLRFYLGVHLADSKIKAEAEKIASSAKADLKEN